MKKISGITDYPLQSLTLILSDGSSVAMKLEYCPQQIGWFADFAWRDWAVQSVRLANFPNVLRQWKNQVPFGLRVWTAAFGEPLTAEVFANGTAILYLLEGDDIATAETLVS
ncbi:MAG: hypothetical protein KGJ86_00685 [Chloroflexota bacterium]|nr:hypothetical protein [Chloroflexota bacterium]